MASVATAQLIVRAAQIAMKGAADYLSTHKIDLATIDFARLDALLKAAILEKYTEAMADAKESLACGMKEVAETTFAASMRLAGIAAVKAYLAS